MTSRLAADVPGIDLTVLAARHRPAADPARPAS
jgi:hypothetical protein